MANRVKVVCINCNGTDYLTIGNVYDLLEVTNHNMYLIVNDNGDRVCYFIYRFISLAKWREQQINSILDD